MTTATAQSHPNIAFIKYCLAKSGRTNRKVCFYEKGYCYQFPVQEMVAEEMHSFKVR